MQLALDAWEELVAAKTYKENLFAEKFSFRNGALT